MANNFFTTVANSDLSPEDVGKLAYRYLGRIECYQKVLEMEFDIEGE